MKRLHIIGRKNHGKTTLIVELVEALTRRGLRVGTIKHTHHRHELDIPGKDSHRHRQAGAVCVGIVSPDLNAAFWPVATDVPHEERYAAFAGLQADCDVILVEGDVETSADKIEVWREGLGSEPLAARDQAILAVVSNDRADVSCPQLPRSPLDELAAWILQRHTSP